METARVTVARLSKPSINSPVMRSTRQVSERVNSSCFGVFSNCSSCVTCGACWPLVSFSTIPISLYRHDIEAAVHVYHFACDAGRERAAQEESAVSDLARLDVAAQRGALRMMFENKAHVRHA